MIENDKQLAITQKWRDDFQAAMEKTILTLPEETENDRLRKKYMIKAQQSTINCFDEEIADYLTNGPITWSVD
jgi:hypothetical protein